MKLFDGQIQRGIAKLVEGVEAFQQRLEQAKREGRETPAPEKSGDAFSVGQLFNSLPQAAHRGLQGAARLLGDPDSTAILAEKTPTNHAETNRETLDQAGALLEAGEAEQAIKILEGMTFFGSFDPAAAEMHQLKVQALHQLGDYPAALSEFESVKVSNPYAGINGQNRYRRELGSLGEEMEYQIATAQEEGNILTEAKAARAAVKIYEALGDTERVEQIASDFEAIRHQAEQLEKKAELQNSRDQAERLAVEGILTPEAIARYEELVPNGPKLSSFLAIEKTSDGTNRLRFTPEFAKLSEEHQQLVLDNLEPILLDGTVRRLAASEADPAKRLYYQAKVDLMDGQIEAARLHFVDFKAAAAGTKDPNVLAMREEARAFLQSLSLNQLELLKSRNEVLKGQRLNHLYDKEDIGLVDRDGIKARAASNARLLQVLRNLVETGAADTLDEALAQLKREAEETSSRESLRQWNYYQNLEQEDADFSVLLKLESRDSLEHQIPGGKGGAFLAAAEKLRHHNGSYQIAEGLLEGALADEFEAAKKTLQDDEWSIRENAYRGYESMRLNKKLREQHEQLKDEDPIEFYARYGQAITRGQFEEELKSAKEDYIQRTMTSKAAAILEARYTSGEMNDPTSRRAWETYREMVDPFHEVTNFSDQGRDALMDEAVLTAITLPITMGVGSAVRGAASGGRLARRISAASSLGNNMVRVGSFTAGSVAEAVTMELLTAPFVGKFHAKNVGYNFVMSVGFHGGAKLWAREAEALGINAAARQAAKRRLNRSAMAIADFSGMMGTQTFLATGLSYLHEPHNSQSVFERLGGSALRMIYGHFGAKVSRSVTRREQLGEARNRITDQAYQTFTRCGMSEQAAMARALKLGDAVKLRKDGSSYFNPDDRMAKRIAAELEPQLKIGDNLGIHVRYGTDGKLVNDRNFRMLARLMDAPHGTVEALVRAKDVDPDFIGEFVKLSMDGKYQEANALLENHRVPFELNPKTGDFEPITRLTEADIEFVGPVLKLVPPLADVLEPVRKAARVITEFANGARISASPHQVLRDVTALNSRILRGDLQAIHEAGAYYRIEHESIGGNAGPNHFAINAVADPRTGKILAVGNIQHLPVEMRTGLVDVTFRVEIPSFKEMLHNRDAVTPITEVIVRGCGNPEVRRALKALRGLAFQRPMGESRSDVIDGRNSTPRPKQEPKVTQANDAAQARGARMRKLFAEVFGLDLAAARGSDGAMTFNDGMKILGHLVRAVRVNPELAGNNLVHELAEAHRADPEFLKDFLDAMGSRDYQQVEKLFIDQRVNLKIDAKGVIREYLREASGSKQGLDPTAGEILADRAPDSPPDVVVLPTSRPKAKAPSAAPVRKAAHAMMEAGSVPGNSVRRKGNQLDPIAGELIVDEPARKARPASEEDSEVVFDTFEDAPTPLPVDPLPAMDRDSARKIVDKIVDSSPQQAERVGEYTRERLAERVQAGTLTPEQLRRATGEGLSGQRLAELSRKVWVDFEKWLSEMAIRPAFQTRLLRLLSQ